MLPVGLLNDVLNYLDVTWSDEETNKKVTGALERGIAYLDFIAGGQQTYTEEGQARALLFDYVRYVRSNALDEFQKNYLHELITLQMQTEVPDDTDPVESTNI